MGRLAAALLAAAVAVAAAPASARMHAPYRGHRILPGGALLDGGGSFSTAVTGAYSFRKLRSAYTGPALRLRRASDNAELDINFLGCTGFTGCPWDSAAAASHCASTTCFAKTWYDQSGLAKDVGQPTPANQPQLIFNCNGSLPCLRVTAAAQILQTTPTYTPVPPLTLSAVGNRSVGTAACYWIRYGSNSFSGHSVAGQWLLFAGTGAAGIAADGVWHAGLGVINGASPNSLVRIDGTETPGTTTGSAVAGVAQVAWGAASTTCDTGEVINWDAYAMAPAERVVLGNNQKSFWGTP